MVCFRDCIFWSSAPPPPPPQPSSPRAAHRTRRPGESLHPCAPTPPLIATTRGLAVALGGNKTPKKLGLAPRVREAKIRKTDKARDAPVTRCKCRSDTGPSRGDRTRDPHVVSHGFRMGGSAWVPQRAPHGFRMGSEWVPQCGFRMGSTWAPHGFRMGSAWIPHGF